MLTEKEIDKIAEEYAQKFVPMFRKVGAYSSAILSISFSVSIIKQL